MTMPSCRALARMSLITALLLSGAAQATSKMTCIKGCEATQTACSTRDTTGKCPEDYKLCVDHCDAGVSTQSSSSKLIRNGATKPQTDATTDKMSQCELRCDESANLCQETNSAEPHGCMDARQTCRSRCVKH